MVELELVNRDKKREHKIKATSNKISSPHSLRDKRIKHARNTNKARDNNRRQTQRDMRLSSKRNIELDFPDLPDISRTTTSHEKFSQSSLNLKVDKKEPWQSLGEEIRDKAAIPCKKQASLHKYFPKS